jgi:hypothetical protein
MFGGKKANQALLINDATDGHFSSHSKVFSSFPSVKKSHLKVNDVE